MIFEQCELRYSQFFTCAQHHQFELRHTYDIGLRAPHQTQNTVVWSLKLPLYLTFLDQRWWLQMSRRETMVPPWDHYSENVSMVVNVSRERWMGFLLNPSLAHEHPQQFCCKASLLPFMSFWWSRIAPQLSKLVSFRLDLIAIEGRAGCTTIAFFCSKPSI